MPVSSGVNCGVTWNANLMQQGNFINVFLARHVSGTYAHHQEQWMLCCSIWFSAPSLWMGGGIESRCLGRVYGAYGALRRHNIRTVHTTYAAVLKTTTHPKTRCRNHMLQLNIHCSWWWAYVPETCRAKNTLIKLPCCIKLAFQVISRGRCTVKQPLNCGGNETNFCQLYGTAICR